jgi:hypothetical protein
MSQKRSIESDDGAGCKKVLRWNHLNHSCECSTPNRLSLDEDTGLQGAYSIDQTSPPRRKVSVIGSEYKAFKKLNCITPDTLSFQDFLKYSGTRYNDPTYDGLSKPVLRTLSWERFQTMTSMEQKKAELLVACKNLKDRQDSLELKHSEMKMVLGEALKRNNTLRSIARHSENSLQSISTERQVIF